MLSLFAGRFIHLDCAKVLGGLEHRQIPALSACKQRGNISVTIPGTESLSLQTLEIEIQDLRGTSQGTPSRAELGGRRQGQVRAVLLSVSLHGLFFLLLLLGGLISLFRKPAEPHEFILSASPPRAVVGKTPIRPLTEPSFPERVDPAAVLPEAPSDPISFDDFIKKHGAPKTAQTTKTKTARVDFDSFNLDELEERIRDASTSADNGEMVSEDAVQSELQDYMLKLKDLINQSWEKPVQSGQGTLEATVQFRVDPKGRISDVQIVGSSGNPVFDTSAVEAVSGVQQAQAIRKSRSLGPTPDGNGYSPRITFRLD